MGTTKGIIMTMGLGHRYPKNSASIGEPLTCTTDPDVFVYDTSETQSRFVHTELNELALKYGVCTDPEWTTGVYTHK